jgi:hypothetical protein
MRISLGAVANDPNFISANCPSVEQLQGIVDINDPCQFSNSGIVSGSPSAAAASLANPTATVPTTVTSSNYLILAAVAAAVIFIGSR